MNSQGSYQIRTIASNVEKEIQLLKAQVDLFWEQELKHYVEFGLRDGMSIAELGSGPGFLTKKMLATFPHLKVTAIGSKQHIHLIVSCIKKRRPSLDMVSLTV